MKRRPKIALFSNERHFEIWFPKKRTITFFWSKLSKLHKKDPILHVATTFSLKQGETRTSSGPLPHPLICLKSVYVHVILNLVLCWLYDIDRYKHGVLDRSKTYVLISLRFLFTIHVFLFDISCEKEIEYRFIQHEHVPIPCAMFFFTMLTLRITQTLVVSCSTGEFVA